MSIYTRIQRLISRTMCILRLDDKHVPLLYGSTAPIWPGPPHCRGFTITLRNATFGRTPLDEWSARRRDPYITTHNTHNRHTPTPPTGFKPAIPESERMKTNFLDRIATGIGVHLYYIIWNKQHKNYTTKSFCNVNLGFVSFPLFSLLNKKIWSPRHSNTVILLYYYTIIVGRGSSVGIATR
jgi:hypothetical protein